ncbi:MAG: CspA family cold shock protein [Candidatus Azotimanducaceae bacterium]|jgi:CspA family cold shock protein
MKSPVKNFVVSIVITAIASIIIGFLNSGGPSVPASISEWLVIAVIYCSTLAATFLGSTTTTETFYAGSETGTVKWFNIKKGYGFITRDQGDDIFVHYRNLQGKGRRVISEGQRVSFVVVDGDKGLQADEVETI